jgi:glycosyltransferase XagB
LVIIDSIRTVDRLETVIGQTLLGEWFLQHGYLTQTQLDRALEYQKLKGGRLGWIIASLGYVTRLELYEVLSKYYGLTFIKDVAYLLQHIDRPMAMMMTHEEITKYQVIPLRLGKDDVLFVLTADPNAQPALEFLCQRFGAGKIEQIVITDLDLMKISEELFRQSIIDKSINGLLYRNPEESAHRVVTRSQWFFLAGLVTCLAVWAFFRADTLIITLFYLVQLFFVIPLFFKLVTSLWSKFKFVPKPRYLDVRDPWDVGDWPIYTILITAYREKEVIGNLIKSLKKLDYPEDKLDIILLMEEDDPETLQAAKLEKPPANWRFLVLPKSAPKTKPKALNYGLHFARGEYLTIYDAEDMPEPHQLKKAVAAFRTHSSEYICFQAALNYFNRDENFLTKMFTLEYSSWFDCLLPGLFKARLPIPLGGTSNHFDVAKLKHIGAWDPFNVTEDADLGIRASMEGYKVGVIDSTTYEEANSRLPNWIKQRSRWVKGYMQTFLVHSRHPLKSIKAMGFWRWLGYAWLIGGTPINFLLLPIMWALFVASIFVNIYGNIHIPDALFYLSAFNLVIGNAIAIFIATLGVFSRKYFSLLPYALLSPIYWLLQSIGAYKGLWQLIFKPFYWEKTAHGLTKYKPIL